MKFKLLQYATEGHNDGLCGESALLEVSLLVAKCALWGLSHHRGTRLDEGTLGSSATCGQIITLELDARNLQEELLLTSSPR